MVKNKGNTKNDRENKARKRGNTDRIEENSVTRSQKSI